MAKEFKDFTFCGQKLSDLKLMFHLDRRRDNLDEKNNNHTVISCCKEKKLLLAYHLSKSGEALTHDKLKELWVSWYPDDEAYLEKLPQKMKGYYNWVSKYIEVHDTEYIKRAISKQRASQRRKLNKIYKNINGHVVIVKAPVQGNRLAKYMLIRGSERRTGDYVSLAIYAKHLKKQSKKSM